MEQSIQEILKTIDNSIAGFQSSIPGIQKTVYDELQPILKELQIKNGKLLNNVSNLKLLGTLQNKLEKVILSAEYKSSVNNFIDSYSSLSSLNMNYFKQFNQKFTPSKTLPYIKELAVESTINSLVGQGMSENVIRPIKDILTQNITSGGNYAKFNNELRDWVLGTGNDEGNIVKYTKQISTDAINQYNAQYHEAIAKDLQFNWGRYVGSNITTSRQFCVLLTKKQWVHKSELPGIIAGHIDNESCKLSKTTGLPYGMIPGTNADNFKVRRGGYNCGHQFFWVPDNVVPANLRDKFKDPNIADKQLQTKESATVPLPLPVDLRAVELSPYIKVVKQKKYDDILPTLSIEQKAAVHGYTDAEYGKLNAYLRGEMPSTPHLENYKNLLNNSLDAIPKKYEGVAYRATTLEKSVINQYKKALKSGDPVVHDYFTSTSTKESGSFDGNVRFILQSKTGKDISPASLYDWEGEILFKSGTSFKVTKMNKAKGVDYIYLDEL